MLGASLLLVLAGLSWMALDRLPFRSRPPLLPIVYVRVEGELENLSPDKLQEALRQSIHGGYFSLDFGEIEGAIRSFGWVDQVRLAKVWPDTLEITIREQEAVARWGDRALLNPRGERFAPEGVEALSHLPVIYGPSGMESQLLKMMKALDYRLETQRVGVASLDLSKRRAWIIRLNNGLELHLGRQDPVKMVDRFLGLVPKLGQDGVNRLKRVDLRYGNGFAVVWKSDDEIGADIQGNAGPASQLSDKSNNLALEN